MCDRLVKDGCRKRELGEKQSQRMTRNILQPYTHERKFERRRGGGPTVPPPSPTPVPVALYSDTFAESPPHSPLLRKGDDIYSHESSYGTMDYAFDEALSLALPTPRRHTTASPLKMRKVCISQSLPDVQKESESSSEQSEGGSEGELGNSLSPVPRTSEGNLEEAYEADALATSSCAGNDSAYGSMESLDMPEGWQRCVTRNGKEYYIDESTCTVTVLDPRIKLGELGKNFLEKQQRIEEQLADRDIDGNAEASLNDELADLMERMLIEQDALQTRARRSHRKRKAACGDPLNTTM